MRTRSQIISQIFKEFTQVNFLMQKMMRSRNNKHKVVTMIQYQVLEFIKDNKQINVSDIADFLKISISSATQLIERLVKQNYLKRIVNQNDRRKVNIQITKEGNQYLIRLEKHINNKSKQVFKNISNEELEIFLEIKQKIAKNICSQIKI